MPATPAQDPIRAVEPPVAAPPAPSTLDDPSLFFDRELSWVDFNDRVLQLAEDERVPLMERAKFAAIWASNLDEFFMIRVAGLHEQVDAGVEDSLPEGLSPSATIDAIRRRVAGQGARVQRCVERELRPALAGHGIQVLAVDDVRGTARERLAERFGRQIFPVLTPLAVRLGRPFPYISNLSLSLAVLVRDPVTTQTTFARVKVPKELLPRFVPVEGDTRSFVLLEELIAGNLSALFPGMEILDHGFFRVTRDADFEVSDEADDLLRALEAELRRRRFGEVVRVEVQAGMDPGLRERLTQALAVEPRQVYDVEGMLDLTDLSRLYGTPGTPSELRDPSWSGVTQPRLQGAYGRGADMFAEMARSDIIVHHPYDSFTSSVERFVEQAVADPAVLAIKMTVYRTSDDTPLIPALIRATERGKQAVCLVELKARFDEQANIAWARSLEQAGVHVVYGQPSLKTHMKAILVVRREGDGVRHYVHVGTGNYNPTTARLYTDFGLFTCDPDIGADVGDVFNVLTGYGRPQGYRKALVAPTGMREGIVGEIERTAQAHVRGVPCRIRLKMNSLVDRACIQALYRASQVGVPIEINTRGICCLRPGVPGVSETIRVVSILGRFLEHSRIYAFHRGDEVRILTGSADIMPRNLESRVELLVPIEDAEVRDDFLDTLERSFAEDTSAWELQPNGEWLRRAPGSKPRSMQRELMASHAARGADAR
ncbi:MAG: polyphosphate kinase 1 [Solirubrobacterales bacterium]|nr:polyphosphate kinase 1 [Solirubrobacterales bacterium]